MTAETLEAERVEVQESLENWRKKLDEARMLAAQAQQQIDMHTGALAQLEKWAKRLAE